MISRQASAVFVLAVLFLPGMGQADQFRPSTYDQCITDSMKGVGSDVAARAIISSCRNQFPQQVAPVALPKEIAARHDEVAPEQEEVVTQQKEVASGTSRSLRPEELARLSATALVFAGSYRITFHNGNEHLTITEVTIAVSNSSEPDGLRRYSQNVRIAPLESESAKYAVEYEGSGFDWAMSDESESTWSVASAKGMD